MNNYGLIGRTLSHSFSKPFFQNKFREEGIMGCSYQHFELASIHQLPGLIETHDLKGLNVTIPYKEEVLPFLHHKNNIVEATGACNCIKIEDGKLFGFNTDVIGFQQSLLRQLQAHHTKALVLGTGGAAKAVAFVLKEAGIEYLQVSRIKKANCLTYEELSATIMGSHLLIVNTTPVGMYPQVDALPPLPYHFITPRHFLYDLVYNPAKTKFLVEGDTRGATICNGYEMLVLQAEESWRIWQV